jgi:chemotaxis-related protein WspD
MNQNCWNEIGVFGNSSCVELKKFHHCTYCPVYAEGARTLLEQEPPVDYLNEWTELLAHEKELQKQNTLSLMLFRIASNWLALPTPSFREIVEVRKTHKIPHRSNGRLLGLVNIKGVLHLCVNIREVLQIESSEYVPGRNELIYSRMVVVERNAKSWAFQVDEILSTQRFAPEEIIPLTDTQKGTCGILEWNQKTFDVLDEKLFFEKLERSID